MSASCEQGITLAGDLHARPAGALAVAAGRFTSAVSVSAGGHTADAKSVLGVMGLGATSGQHVTVSAAGPDAREAVAALIEILSEATKVGGLPARAGPAKLHGHRRSSGRITFLSRTGFGACPAAAPRRRGGRCRCDLTSP
jgi:phosphocarrier protein HPr